MKPILIALAVWCATRTRGFAGPQGFTLYSAPQDMPDLRFVTQRGSRKTLSDLRGKMILVNIWSTWCPPCVKEMPALDSGDDQSDPVQGHGPVRLDHHRSHSRHAKGDEGLRPATWA